MILDAFLSILHFWAVITMGGALISEYVLIRAGLDAARARALAWLDVFYGISAAVVFAAGLIRVFFGLRSAEAYLGDVFFWAKLTAFGVLVLSSAPATMAYVRWRRAAIADPGFAPPHAETVGVRRWLLVELHLLALIVVFAAFMARGYGAPAG